MRSCIIPGVGLALMMSLAAGAEEPVDPAGLGNLDGMLATCHELYPAGQAAYETLRAAMTGEQPADALAALAQTPQYRQAYEESRKQAAAEPLDAARAECARLAAVLGPGAHRGEKSKKSRQAPPMH